MTSFDEVMRLAMKNVGKNPQGFLKDRFPLELPKLKPAHRPNKVPRNISKPTYIPPPTLVPASVPRNSVPSNLDMISFIDLVAQQRSSISELKNDIKVHEASVNQIKVENVRLQKQLNELVAEQEEERNRFGAELDAMNKRAQKLEAKNIRLQKAEMVSAEKEKQELARSQKLLEELKADQNKELAQLETKLVAETERAKNLEEENVRLQSKLDIQPQHQFPSTKRCKQLHKCLNCDYETTKSYAMKVHREEGCKNAKVVQTLKCEICHRDVTHNTYRYHLNQYTKRSSHAKNGHEKFTPAEHVQMLAKLKKNN